MATHAAMEHSASDRCRISIFHFRITPCNPRRLFSETFPCDVTLLYQQPPGSPSTIVRCRLPDQNVKRAPTCAVRGVPAAVITPKFDAVIPVTGLLRFLVFNTLKASIRTCNFVRGP